LEGEPVRYSIGLPLRDRVVFRLLAVVRIALMPRTGKPIIDVNARATAVCLGKKVFNLPTKFYKFE
jgi:hypothetical protein